LESRHVELARWLVPAVIVASAIWVGVLAYLNVRQRREEIGILRAIGLRRRGVIAVFEGKAILIGLVGGGIGVLLGLLAVQGSGSQVELVGDLWAVRSVKQLLLSAPLAAVLFSVVASWLPALLAANQDPALILEQE
ncbi:MAG: FtsX-like permease family protein, partial [Planctomycetaceae bacterium]|nr:FtsX-like permease family protein [Planctomycetaceae bacterium]